MKKYKGGCHCGEVKFEVETDLKNIIECDCSHCSKKGFLLSFVDKDKFELKSGKNNLTEYFFNKKSIRHLFCQTCGVASFSEGVTFPKVAINIRCFEGVNTSKLTVIPFKGKDL